TSRRFKRGELLLTGAVRVRYDEMAFRQPNVTYEGKPLLVRSEARGCVNVFDQLPRRAAEHWYLEQVTLGAIELSRHIIDIVAVAREGHPIVKDLRRRHDLDVTCGIDLTDPQALPPEIVNHMNNVATIGRDDCVTGLACVCQSSDLEALERERRASLAKQLVNEIAYSHSQRKE